MSQHAAVCIVQVQSVTNVDYKIHSKSHPDNCDTGKWLESDHQLPLGEQQNVHLAPEAFRDVKAPGTGHLPPGRRGVA